MTPTTDHPIFLCGMMGSGKTTIARTLASELKRPWTDLDRCIETHAGIPIPEIFKREGESGFRERERQALDRVMKGPAAVIALGGGALQDQEMVQRIRQAGWLIFLDAPQSVLLERLGKRTGRPLTDELSRDELQAKLDSLYEQREGFYRQAHITIPVGEASPAQIATLIHETIQSRSS